MSNASPEPPAPEKQPLGQDEWIAMIVAFTAIGTILFWGMRQGKEGFNLLNSLTLQTPAPQAPVTPTVIPENQVTPAPTPAMIPPQTTTITPVPVPLRPTTPVAPAPAVPLDRTIESLPVPVPVETPEAIAPSPTASPAPAFSDVSPDYWAYPYIMALAEREMMTGFPDGTFQPDRPLTRAELAAVLQKGFTLPPGQAAIAYSDVPADHWAVPAIASVTQNQFVKGYPGNIYRPEQTVSRLESLIALASGLNLQSPADPTQTLQAYPDSAAVPPWAAPKLAAAQSANLIINPPNQQQLAPQLPTTRGQMAVMLYQSLVHSGQMTQPSP